MATPEETVPEKTRLHTAEDMLSGLKEMIHYVRSNAEKLSEFRLFMEDELKREEFAEKMNDLLDKQTSFHNDLEEKASEIQAEIHRIRNEGGDSL